MGVTGGSINKLHVKKVYHIKFKKKSHMFGKVNGILVSIKQHRPALAYIVIEIGILVGLNLSMGIKKQLEKHLSSTHNKTKYLIEKFLILKGRVMELNSCSSFIENCVGSIQRMSFKKNFSIQILSVLRGHSFFHPRHNGQ